MRKNTLKLLTLPVALLAGFLSGCDWVDSTGRDGNNAPITEIALGDGGIDGPQVIQELSVTRVTAKGTDTDGTVRNWKWSDGPIAQGNLPQCSALDGFAGKVVAKKLATACKTPNCNLQFELQSSDADVAEFFLSTPELIASVGVTYRLTAIDNEGGEGYADYTFCVASMNKPPVAVDDTFTVLEGQLLTITPSRINLLSNDTDDTEEASSLPLRVIATPVTEPASANVFQLRTDGGFSYSFKGANLIRDVTDSFEYSITDGEFTDTATVTINVVADNNPPIANGVIAALTETEGVDFSFDLADFFTDPEGNTLEFSVVGAGFPPSGGIELSPIGVLSGAGLAADVGTNVFTINVSDGVSSITSQLSLTVVDNKPVTVIATPVQKVDEGASISVAMGARFSDPESELLEFSMAKTLPAVNLAINPRTGLISGFISEAGEYAVTVSASDGYNPATTTVVNFEVEAVNQAPEFVGVIANQTGSFGLAITPIRPVFTDPEGDALTYTLVGTVPLGIVLNDQGQLVGFPLRTGVFSGLVIVATDSEGLSAETNEFTLTVVVGSSRENTEPEFVGSISDQSVEAGLAITPIEPVFTDADEDTLTYSLIGELPQGVTLSADGVIAGIPLVVGVYDGLAVVASDPDGLTAETNEFSITVLR